ncbi:peptide-N4-(N-acetyl-beta-glucosaminyl)asparagine amidase A [Sodiomyces alkalinus F11]|uniref:Peptide-N4-(N-acetyl-beta-glucosaminyl)asparagine amidase A n=1 Tax=Sodiomyces alkalinus (strain CBS 110278 / VKM F-3762 / F11) TaxID=1314773 RepID=A0A3N2PJA9_SODAK|nr:peptide-N4-(N-acetyl-beta-glucosaminyl)asparagine amidase A [Sodiomyces alkalinus F11]ROT34464.1 peptide-N4-(N-acetyl-beta-glucosaminyl)asparagine amidase A [Sodiomyces alkalinus F11]
MRPPWIALLQYLVGTSALGLEDQHELISSELEHELLAPQDQPDRAVLAEGHAWPEAPLECIQVAQPVRGPSGPVLQGTAIHSLAGEAPGEPCCSMLLMEHSFGFSYGKPFVGQYQPPGCDFDRVIMNFTVTSAGRQFDRLALMFFNDTEVWRTSTAEPKPSPGIVWTYWKDMTQYLSLWKAPQTLIFDLGNLINDKYTGSFNCTLTATFFKSNVAHHGSPPADLVIPISARKGATGSGSAWTVPQQQAINTVSFPRNAVKAVFSVSANGQASEEFWWSNVLQSDVAAFNKTVGLLPGLSPFREVQVYIDDRLAGAAWPFPVVFTGGVSPSLHRPVVGLEAFDLREHEVDLSPWLPLLCDGNDHTFRIRVVGLYDDKNSAFLTDRIGDYWVVTGKIFVWLDEEGSVTTGRSPEIKAPEPAIRISHETRQNDSWINEDLTYSLHVQRNISVKGEVTTRNGSRTSAWAQALAYTNLGAVASFGNHYINNMTITGAEQAQGPRFYFSVYSYPLYANSSHITSPTNNLTIEAELDQGLYLEIRGDPVFPTGLEAFTTTARNTNQSLVGSRVATFRTGQASFYQSGDGRHSSGFGSTRQHFCFGGIKSEGGSSVDVELYRRDMAAVNDTVIFDEEKVSVPGPIPSHNGSRHRQQKHRYPEREQVGPFAFAPAKGKHVPWGSIEAEKRHHL